MTAALQLANTIAQIVLLAMESQPPDVRAELARLQFDDVKKWREFFDHFTSPSHTTQAQVDTAMSGERVRLAREKKDGA